MTMITTLNKIREHAPCINGWEKLLKHLGKTKGDDEPLAITTILDSNGLDDALWCLRAVKGHDREMRLYAVWCARRVQHLMKDQRSLAALGVAERHANGHATDAELSEARAEAWDAAWNAEIDAARDSAFTAASYAAIYAASYAAWEVARAAAEDAAGEVAENAASDAVWGPARKAERAAQAAELRRFCAEIEAQKGTP